MMIEISSFQEVIPLGFAIGFGGVSICAICGKVIGSLFSLLDSSSR